MFRRRCPSKEMRPEVVLLLRHQSRYPGDLVQGVVIVDILSPSDILALEVRVCGDERSALGGFFVTDKNPEARKTTYYEQFITLRGVDHDLLCSKRSPWNHRRTAETEGRSTECNSALPPQSSSAGNIVPEPSPSMVQSASEAAVHLIPGTYSYPFSLVLPDNLPPSCELRRGHDDRCILRYHAVASLIMTSGKIHTSEAGFRINPLPVQVQRWYQLHNDEQQLCGDAVNSNDADDNETVYRAGVASVLMSSAGALRMDKSEQFSDITHQRRIRHYRQFSEAQLMLETAIYAETADERAEKKKRRVRERHARGRGSLLAAAKTTAVIDDSAEKQQNQRDQEESDRRSLDSKDGAAGAANNSDDDAGDKVYVFGTEDPLPTVAASIRGEGEYDNGELHGNSGGTSAESSRALVSRGGKKTQHHLLHPRDATDSPADTVMLENNVDKLTFTPPEADFSAPMAVPDLDQMEAVSHQTGHRSSKEMGKKQSCSKQRHRSLTHFQPKPWKQEFFINLRSGLLRTGKVRVLLSLRSPLVTVGIGKVGVTALIDNSDGSAAISRVKYSLVTQCYIRTRTEVYNFEVDAVELTSDVSVEKGKLAELPEVELPVPKSTPLTMLTEGMGTYTLVNVRLYVSTSLKTFSRSVATEVVVVPGQDVLNCSRRLLRWTCFFRRRHGDDDCVFPLHPHTINLSAKNTKLRVIGAEDINSAREQGNPSLHSNNTDAPTIATSATSRSMQILRTSQRISKAGPPINVQLLAKMLNYEEALFVPRDGDDGSNFPKHVDPLSALNPFAAPASDVMSSLEEGGNSETLCH
ncbi:hypothetical protein, conserved [Leishmania tarentolae]|uniref:Arrestin-like N-terminal domain-containing protein n=1 Tax=Leishmania tarentolae TaxID=5689 RepID=A0A640KWI2_LEITA|nr:hypothetical protein, conserved [Leishmania tarentolae]